MRECITTDVLVIGSGIAGITTAVALAKKGISVVVITAANTPDETNTKYAQGGIIYKGVDDSAHLLKQDIISAGWQMNNASAVSILCKEGPGLVEQLLINEADIPFDQVKEQISLAREGGHSVSRIAHVQDRTGESIEEHLLRVLKKQGNITLLPSVTAIDLLTPNHVSLKKERIYEPLLCIGAYVFDRKTKRVNRILSKYTVLATGGLGQLFLYTTNPQGARGDGIAIANRAGCRTINLEFVQFHPTALALKDAPRFLITEAVRGKGARLVDHKGHPFMQKYDNVRADLSTRDIVSRAIYTQMLMSGVEHVYLDLPTYIPPKEILNAFPNMYAQCKKYGIDITRELIPVAPAAHYSCGGIWVDVWGETTISRLFAVGEVSCNGLHGANRLASTSLLEGLVFGSRAARKILETIASTPAPQASEIPQWVDQGTVAAEPALIAQDMGTIKSIMWNYVGLVRKGPLLERACHDLAGLEGDIEHFYKKAILTEELIGLRNMVRSASLIASAAMVNTQSIGCHYRERN